MVSGCQARPCGASDRFANPSIRSGWFRQSPIPYCGIAMPPDREKSMAEDIYRELRRSIDRLSFGFPETESQIELDILRKLFSPEDAQTWLLLTPKLESPDEFAERTGSNPEACAGRLHDMAQRGLIYRGCQGDAVKYATIGFMHGIWEFQLPTMDRELAEMTAKYLKEEATQKVLLRATAGFLRTIPVQRSLGVVHHVAAFEDASRFLRNAKKIAVAECICGKNQGLIGQGCDKPREVCFMMVPWASTTWTGGWLARSKSTRPSRFSRKLKRPVSSRSLPQPRIQAGCAIAAVIAVWCCGR
jgi:hypothetical protein